MLLLEIELQIACIFPSLFIFFLFRFLSHCRFLSLFFLSRTPKATEIICFGSVNYPKTMQLKNHLYKNVGSLASFRFSKYQAHKISNSCWHWMREHPAHRRSRGPTSPSAPSSPSNELTPPHLSALQVLQPASMAQIAFEVSLVNPAWSSRSSVVGTLTCPLACSYSHLTLQNAPPPRQHSKPLKNQGRLHPNC